MPRLFFVTLPVAALFIGSLLAADQQEKKDKQAPSPTLVTLLKVDPKTGEITVQFGDGKGKEQQKTFHLTKDVRLLDETGRVVTLEVFESGSQALILEAEGKLQELRRPIRVPGHRLSDAVKTLIEMAGSQEGSLEEVQRIYDMLRKLDTDKNGTINRAELQAAGDRFVAERVKALIQRLDTDKDGKISKEEAKGLVKEHFDKLDLNKDGFLDYEELFQAAKAKHEAKVPQTEK